VLDLGSLLLKASCKTRLQIVYVPEKTVINIIAILYSRGMLIRNQYAGIEEKTIQLSPWENNKKQARTLPAGCIL
jgi:hypothetical protein